jgi:uncharacterized RmlC-like cupin family protein
MAELKLIRPDQRDRSTAQTPGMDRAEGVGACTAGATSIWSGHVTVGPGVKSGAHHHGEVESAIYIISGRARFRYGEHLENMVEANAGDFVYVPAYVVHQEINASDSEPVVMIVSRGSQENVVVNVDIPEAKEVQS